MLASQGALLSVPYDLHIHSSLSPCGENEMTPGNIVGMAGILGLSVIAVSDHNSARNLPAVLKLGAESGILVVPGIEVTTAEEVHVLSLFPSLEAALSMGEELYAALPMIANQPEIFGDQLILDEEDQVTGSLEKLLINAVSFSIDRVFEMVRERGGIPIPAHIDKSSYSILSSLGFIPPEIKASTVEVSPRGLSSGFVAPQKPEGVNYQVISNSDAHSLPAFSSRDPLSLSLPSCSVRAVLEALGMNKDEV